MNAVSNGIHPGTARIQSCVRALLLVQVDRVVLFVLLHVPPHGFFLLAQSGYHLVVHVGKKEFGVGLQALLRLLEGLHHHLARLLPPAALVVLAPPASGRHVVPQSGDGVVLLVPVVHLVHRAVGRAVVAGAVVADPKRYGKDSAQRASTTSGTSGKNSIASLICIYGERQLTCRSWPR